MKEIRKAHRQALLQRLMDEKYNGHQVALSNAAGIAQSLISRYLNGGKGIGEDMAQKIETNTGYIGWFEQTESAAQIPAHAIPVRPGKIKGVTVVGAANGTFMPERIWDDTGYPTGHSDQIAEVASADQEAFVFEVKGNSMAPKYVHGDYALAEPNTDIDLEDDVVVRLKSGESLLKRLISRRGGITLSSYNEPGHIVLQMTDYDWMYYVAYPVPRKKIKNRV